MAILYNCEICGVYEATKSRCPYCKTEIVEAKETCPNCHENREEMLPWLPGGVDVKCQNCNTVFTPPNTSPGM